MAVLRHAKTEKKVVLKMAAIKSEERKYLEKVIEGFYDFHLLDIQSKIYIIEKELSKSEIREHIENLYYDSFEYPHISALLNKLKELYPKVGDEENEISIFCEMLELKLYNYLDKIAFDDDGRRE